MDTVKSVSKPLFRYNHVRLWTFLLVYSLFWGNVFGIACFYLRDYFTVFYNPLVIPGITGLFIGLTLPVIFERNEKWFLRKQD